jgi:uncharacterized BrkB/YihY/UPF0761 family membrane protein
VSADEAHNGAPERFDWLGRWWARARRAEAHYQELARSRPLLGLPLTFLARYAARQGVLMASAVAFRLFLWLLPLALLGAGVAAGLARDQGGDVQSAVKAAGIGGAAKSEVVQALHNAHRSWWVAVLVGGILVLWTTRSLVRTLTVVTAHAWQVPPSKRGLKGDAATTLTFLGGAFGVFAAAAAVAALDGRFLGGLVLGILIQGLAAAGVWLLICKRLPGGHQDWLDLLPGCVLFGASLAVLHDASRVYLPSKIARSAAMYGALGVAGVILGWLLIIGQVIVCSALVNSVWADYRIQRREGFTQAG